MNFLILNFTNFAFLLISIIMLICIYGFVKMSSIYTKFHLSGIIDNFILPISALLFIGLIFINQDLKEYLILKFFISTKIAFIVLFLIFSSILNTHAICKIYFNEKNK
jgi:hypothetical protein